jgi:hypothetical protein
LSDLPASCLNAVLEMTPFFIPSSLARSLKILMK